MSESVYIEPRVVKYGEGKISEFFCYLENESVPSAQIDLKDLTSINTLFVFGEPGFGKSRLLRNIFNSQSESGQKCALIDLKKVKGTIIDYITKLRPSNGNTPSPPWFTDEFHLTNHGEHLLILDALDEVCYDDVYLILKQITSLHRDFPKLKIIVSCRTHHASRHKSMIQELDFECVEILPFSQWQIAQFIKKNDSRFFDSSVREVLSQLNLISINPFIEYRGPLSVPRYLELFLVRLKERDLSYATGLKRSELFEFFITERLKKESDVQSHRDSGYSRKIPYLRQCFERVALLLEIQRANIISKDDFASFEIDANLSVSNQLLLETFYDGTLLKDNDNHLEFDNTEFQEYLAACAIQRLGKYEQVIFDVAVDQKFRMIYPGWIDVLGYLVEQRQEVIIPLMEFGCRAKNPELFDLLEYADPKSFHEKEKDVLFRQIIQFSINQKRWLWYQLSHHLAKLYKPELHDDFLVSTLNEDFSFQDYFTVTFISEILADVFKQGTEGLHHAIKDKWNSLLLPYLEKGSGYGTVMHRSILNVLHYICTIDDFEPYRGRFWDASSDVFGAMVNFYERSNPNHRTSIRLFLKVIMVGHGVRLDSPLEKINSTEGFLNFFDELEKITVSDQNHKLWRRSEKIFSDELVENLRKVLNPDIEQKVTLFLETLLQETRSWKEASLVKLTQMLQGYDEEFISRFLAKILGNSSMTPWMAFNIGELLGQILSVEQYHKIESQLLTHPMAKQVFLWLCEHHIDPEIKNKYLEFFPEEGQKQQSARKKRELKIKTFELRKANKEREIYAKLLELLNNNDFNFFEYYEHSEDSVKALFSNSQHKRIEKLTHKFLTKYGAFDIKMTKQKVDNNWQTTYNIPIRFFWSCLKLIAVEKIPVDQFRLNVIGGLLFLWNPNDIDVVLSHLDPILPEELAEVASRYLEKRNDEFYFKTIRQFINLCKRAKADVSSLLPFFEDLARKPTLVYYIRSEILKFINEQRQDIVFLASVFDRISQEPQTEDTIKLQLDINYLLLVHNYPPAVQWRIDYIFEHKYILKKNNGPGIGTRRVLPNEGVGRPLALVKSEVFISIMCSLLERSFDLVLENSEYFHFIQQELWIPITDYFLSLNDAQHKHFEIVDRLVSLTSKYQQAFPVHFFNSRVSKIKNHYLELRSQSMSVGEATKVYLKIRQKQYLDLAYPSDVFQLVVDVIRYEFANWVRQGFYQFIGQIQAYKGHKVRRETIIQQTMVSQLEAFLLRKELRSLDIYQTPPNLYREVQLLDEKKADLIISYGLLGAVLIEVKRMGNSDLRKYNLEEYKINHFLPYMQQTNCQFGIFLVFLDQEQLRRSFPSTIKNLEKTYLEHDNIKIIGIDCL